VCQRIPLPTTGAIFKEGSFFVSSNSARTQAFDIRRKEDTSAKMESPSSRLIFRSLEKVWSEKVFFKKKVARAGKLTRDLLI
jgi:hypothetical protein